MSGRAPFETRLGTVVPAVTAAADDITVVGIAPFDGEITAVVYIAESDITGADTESRSLNVHNRGAAGDGTTELASIDFVAGTDAAQYDETALTLSVVADATTVVQGDIITVQSQHVGTTGLADPGGSVFVTIARS